MRKILFAAGLVLELLLLGGAGAVYYFSVKRMGMARHVLFLNGQWEDQYPVDAMILVALAVVAVDAILVLFFYFRKRPFRSRLPWVGALQSGIFSALFLLFGLGYDTGKMRAYYLVLLLLFLYCLVMNIRNLAVILSEGKDPGTARAESGR